MRERVLAIVSIIAQYVLDEREELSETELVKELLAVGFEAEEIDAAFRWMENVARPAATGELLLPATHRVFTAEEQRGLSLEARGFLVRLRMMGILDDETEEEVIERALQDEDEPVTLREIQALTALTLFARSQDAWRRELGCILEDDWPRLYH